MTDRCRIGVTDDLLLDDGSLAFPGYDLGPLTSHPGLALVRVPGGVALASEALAAIDVLVSVPLTAAVTRGSLARAGRLAGIVRVGVGCEDVDLDACTDAGVAVVIPAEAVRRPTAVAALCLLLALATRLIEKDRLSRMGDAAWGRRAELRGRNLTGRVLGLVGCGSIGSDLARLVQPLGLRVMACDPLLSAPDAAGLGIERADLAGVLAAADFVSIHCPLTAETRNLLDRDRLAGMKRGACLINTARGGIVDQDALIEALRSGQLAGAALDVFDPEPLPPQHPLLAAEAVILGAHALNWTEELDSDLAAQNVAAVFALVSGRTPHKVVNPAVLAQPAFAAKRDALARRFGVAVKGATA